MPYSSASHVVQKEAPRDDPADATLPDVAHCMLEGWRAGVFGVD